MSEDKYGPPANIVKFVQDNSKAIESIMSTWQLEAALSASQAREAELREKLEAVEAKIKASQEQEPVGEVMEFIGDEKFVVRINRPTNVGELLYPAATIPPELAELQRELEDMRGLFRNEMRQNAELTRKLAEQQAIQTKIANFLQNESGLDNLRDLAQAMLDCFKSDKTELRKLLESKVPEGWQLVPMDIGNSILFREFLRRRFGMSFGSTKQAWVDILSQAPQPPKE